MASQNSILISFPENSESQPCGVAIINSCLSYNSPLIVTKVLFSEDLYASISSNYVNTTTLQWNPNVNNRLYEWTRPSIGSSNQNYLSSNVSYLVTNLTTFNVQINLDETVPAPIQWSEYNGNGWNLEYGKSSSNPITTELNLGSFAVYALLYDGSSAPKEALFFAGNYELSTVQSFSTTSGVLGNIVYLNTLMDFTSLSQDIGNITYVVEENPYSAMPTLPSVSNLPYVKTINTTNTNLTLPNCYLILTNDSFKYPTLAYRDYTATNTGWLFSNYFYYMITSSGSVPQPAELSMSGANGLSLTTKSLQFTCSTLSEDSTFTSIFAPGSEPNPLDGQLVISLISNNSDPIIQNNYPGLSRVIIQTARSGNEIIFTMDSPIDSVLGTNSVNLTNVNFNLFVMNGINMKV